MDESTMIMIGIGLGCFIITVYYQCKAVINQGLMIRNLTEPVYPNNAIPVTNGIRVDIITEDFEIITPD